MTLAASARSPSPGTPGEGRGEGDFDFTAGLGIPIHPHPNPLPAYRERGPEPFRWGRGRGSRVLTITLLLSILGLVIHRALTWSITADEALTYIVYLSDGWRQLLRYGPNNHVLFTWLAKASIAAFGPREWSLRLPTLIAAAGYLACVGFIVCRFFGGCWRLLAAGLLAINPLVLDYLVAARGYGLACALLLAGEALVLVDHQVSEDSAGGRRRAIWRRVGISICCALSVVANLAFAPAAAALVVVSLWRSRGKYPLPLVLPGALVGVILLGPYLLQLRHSAMQVGFVSPRFTVVDLWNASLQHDATAPSSLRQVTEQSSEPVGVQTLGGDIAALVGILVLLLCIVQAPRSRAQPRSPANAAAGSLLVTVLLIVALHVGAKVPYPAARTALYLLPMATLAVLLAAITWSAPARAVTLVGAVLLLLWYGVELHSRCFAYARYDAGAKPLFLAMQRDARLHFRRPVRVGGTWIYEPAVNFYRALYHAGWMLPMRRDYQKPEPSQYDYFLANADDYPQLQLSDYRLVAADPVSGTRLITRSE